MKTNLKLIFRPKVSKIYPAMSFLSPPHPSSSNVINGGMKLRSRSEEDLNKLDDCMEDMDADISKLFDECHQPELHNDLELCGLVKDYFKTIKEVTELCGSLRMFLSEISEDNKSLVVSDFVKRCHICHNDLSNMIGELVTTMKHIDKKLKHVREKRAIVTAAIIAPVIVFTVAVGIVAPAVMLIIKGIVDKVPMEVVFKRIVSSWKKCTKVLKGEKTVMSSMKEGTRRTLIKVDKISKIIGRLETLQKSFQFTSEDFKSILVELKIETERCDGRNQFVRKQIFDYLVQLLSCGEKLSL